MNCLYRLLFYFCILLASFQMSSCLSNSTGSNTVDSVNDAQMLAALKNVSIAEDSVTMELQLPEEIESGRRLNELRQMSSKNFDDASLYGMTLRIYSSVSNTKKDARQAEFKGMRQVIEWDTLQAYPQNVETEGFIVKKGEKKIIVSQSSLNYQKDREILRYLFAQIVAGEKAEVKLSSHFKYEIGKLSGEFELPPPLPILIPTRADDNTKRFLSELLAADDI